MSIFEECGAFKLCCFRHLSEYFFLSGVLYGRNKFAKFCHVAMKVGTNGCIWVFTVYSHLNTKGTVFKEKYS